MYRIVVEAGISWVVYGVIGLGMAGSLFPDTQKACLHMYLTIGILKIFSLSISFRKVLL